MDIWELIKDKIWTTSDGDLEVIDVDSVRELIKEAYNQALEDASENAEFDIEFFNENISNLKEGQDYEVALIRNSILKLKIK